MFRGGHGFRQQLGRVGNPSGLMIDVSRAIADRLDIVQTSLSAVLVIVNRSLGHHLHWESA